MAAALPITPQSRAQAALLIARSAFNARKPDTAIQACTLIITEAEFANPVWQGGVWNVWPSPKALMYITMAQELATLDGFTKAKDKDLLLKFITEQIGLEGAKFQIRQALNRNIPDADFHEFHGPGVINLIYQDPAPPDGTGLLYAAEAKGETSQLKAGQGTMANLKKEAQQMRLSNFKATRRLSGESAAQLDAREAAERRRRRLQGQIVITAIAQKKARFLTVRAFRDPKKNPKTELSV
jgi:hypothetical protein